MRRWDKYSDIGPLTLTHRPPPGPEPPPFPINTKYIPRYFYAIIRSFKMAACGRHIVLLHCGCISHPSTPYKGALGLRIHAGGGDALRPVCMCKGGALARLLYTLSEYIVLEHVDLIRVQKSNRRCCSCCSRWVSISNTFGPKMRRKLNHLQPPPPVFIIVLYKNASKIF